MKIQAERGRSPNNKLSLVLLLMIVETSPDLGLGKAPVNFVLLAVGVLISGFDWSDEVIFVTNAAIT